MRDLELFEQYLIRLRQERYQKTHTCAVEATTPDALYDIKARACEAEQVTRILAALKVLAKDSGTFIMEFLQ